MRSFLISSNIWVGLAVALLSLMSFPQPWTAASIYYVLFLFFATISAYSYMRWVKIVQGNTGGQVHQVAGLEKNILILLYALFSAFLAIGFLRLIWDQNLIWSLSPAILVAVFYPIAFPNPHRYFTSLRTVPMLKLLLISASWAWLSYGIPMLMSQAAWSPFMYGEIVMRSLLIAGLTIPFDIRDLDYDAQKMRTIPQLFGVDWSLNLARVLLLLYQLWLILAYFQAWLNLALVLAWLTGLELGALLIKKVNNNRSDWYIGFWVEGIPSFIFILYLLAQWTLGNY